MAANTFLPTGDDAPGDAFLAWQTYSQETPDLHAGGIVKGGCVTDLGPEVMAAYDAPFPDDSYKEGARQFPLPVPTRPDDPASAANRSAWEGLRTFSRPFLCAFSDSDPSPGAARPRFRPRSRAPPARPTPPSPEPATSSRRTKAKT